MKNFSAYGFADIGSVRTVNEDHILLGRFIKNRGGMGLSFSEDDDFARGYGLIFAVADGIGGERAGEVASRIALEVMEQHYYGFTRDQNNPDAFTQAVLISSTKANERILELSACRPEYRGMGCTLSGICLMPSGILTFNAGDSRVYRFRAGSMRQLTEDDSLVGLAVRMGHLTIEEAAVSPQRHTIINNLGSSGFRITIQPLLEWQDNDHILICSDGLHDMVSVDMIKKTLGVEGSPEQAVRSLVQQAKDNGGYDNISAIIVHCTEGNGNDFSGKGLRREYLECGDDHE
ncbi:MAG: serine/threonine-protein phosphatase [Desulforudis sp.]|jgi:protein phosphatase|nr:MAG: serine/threonine-protein phosphatase [Desulforudis sp.]